MKEQLSGVEPILVELPADKREHLRRVPVGRVGGVLLALAGIMDSHEAERRERLFDIVGPDCYQDPDDAKWLADRAEAKRQRRQARNLRLAAEKVR